MRKKLSIVVITLLALLITFFTIKGEVIRDYYSPHTSVMPPIMHTFSDGTDTITGLSNSCITTNEDGVTTAFIVEEKSDTGEKAYYAKKVELTIGKSDDKCTDIIKAPTYNALFICSTDRNITDGDRIVIEKITNGP